jgi:serine/threonine protein kinase
MKPDSEQAADESTHTHVSGRGDNLDTVTEPSSAALEFIPESFGHFELLEMLGYGGMGVVYRAKDTRLSREVALKKLLGAAADHPVLRGRFDTEAKAIARLHHPNLMPILEYGQIKNQPYFTMPLLSGCTLAERIGDYQKDTRAAVELMIQLARAVQHAHENQILHRDLKPSNILFDDEGKPIVADFGIAKLLDTGGDITATGAVLGTPAYMSPEQAAGKINEISPRSDIWALGIMLYELVTGGRPFKGTTREELTPQILNEEVLSPAPQSQDLNEPLTRMILKCLQKSPADRYQCAGHLADDLQAWLQGGNPQVRLPRSFPRRALLSVSFAGILALLAGSIFWGLSKGQLEPLVDANGRPRHPVWITPEVAMTNDAEAKTITIHSEGRTFLELGRDVKAKHYRFCAQVRINNTLQPSGSAGIFIGGSSHLSNNQDIQCCLVLDSQRSGFEQKGDPVEASRCYPLASALPRGAVLIAGEDFETYPVTKTSDGWCALVWEVSPNQYVAKHWDDIVCARGPGDFLGHFHLSKINESKLDLSKATPQFLPSDGIGLYVCDCNVSYRDIVIERLP